MNYMHEANAIAARLRGTKPAGALPRGRMPSRSGPHRRATASPRSLEVLAYMQGFFSEHDQLPPIAFIARAFGWGALGAAHYHVLQLAQHGHIERNATGKWRFARAPRATE